MTSEEPEVLTTCSGGVMTITLNRPSVRNAINSPLAEGLVEAVGRLNSDVDLHVGVVTGAGTFFCAGMDLKAFAAHGSPRGLRTFYAERCAKPLIAAVEGGALAGGMEVALTCDLIVAANDSRFALPEVKVGLLAAGGAAFRLPQRLPFAVALEMALTGDSMTADVAHRHGFVNHLTPPGETLAAASELARRIASNAPLSVCATKKLMWGGAQLEEDGWKRQAELVRAIFASKDAQEGAKAFVERRSPVWSGS